MPDKPLTVLTYAASASLAAVALVYFFNPNYLIDGDSATSSANTRKKGIVGLFNPANDCFINSVLQSLAGLGDLRLYLIREAHRRELGGPEIYDAVPLVDSKGKEVDARKLGSLQSGEVTLGLKSMIDSLNERPIYRKTISATPFIKVLEHAFDTRMSKSQQDAQELLQVVAERLSEEYHAGREARKRAFENRDTSTVEQVARRSPSSLQPAQFDEESALNEAPPDTNTESYHRPPRNEEAGNSAVEECGFPLEGKTEARIECQHCHFVPKVTPTSFVMLNLMVPQKSSTSLNECIDSHFKTEFIDDYVCDRCRLEHALDLYSTAKRQTKTREQREVMEEKINKLRTAIGEDPEKAPEGVELPELKLAPKRRIARHVEITTFPKILVIHLSRSLFDPRSSSTKNLATVSFPERFPVGGLLNRRTYKLLGVITHRGTHHSGHYETFRRQHFYAPYSTPHVDSASGPYGTAETPTRPKSSVPSPQRTPPVLTLDPGSLSPRPATITTTSPSSHSPSPSTSLDSQSSPSTPPSSGSVSSINISKTSMTPPKVDPPKSSKEKVHRRGSQSRPSSASTSKGASIINVGRLKRKKKPINRWWRISDDKIKECKTSDVLSMQKEVYMLFYEMEREDGDKG